MITKQVPFVRLLAVGAPLLLASTLLAQEPAAEQRSVLADVFAYDNAGLVGYIIILNSATNLELRHGQRSKALSI